VEKKVKKGTAAGTRTNLKAKSYALPIALDLAPTFPQILTGRSNSIKDIKRYYDTEPYFAASSIEPREKNSAYFSLAILKHVRLNRSSDSD